MSIFKHNFNLKFKFKSWGKSFSLPSSKDYTYELSYYFTLNTCASNANVKRKTNLTMFIIKQILYIFHKNKEWSCPLSGCKVR